jgi:hypothetical protein
LKWNAQADRRRHSDHETCDGPNGLEVGSLRCRQFKRRSNRSSQIDVDQYKYGFETDIEMIKAPKGLNEDIVRFISEKKGEPAWMLEWRLDAYERWLAMTEPTWAKVNYPKIDFQDLYYYRAERARRRPRASTRSIRNCSRPTRSWAFR